MVKAIPACALLLLSLNAGAAPDRLTTLTTGMMQVPVNAGAYRQCDALNVSGAPLEVTMELVDVNGLVESSGTWTLAPGQSVFLYSGQTIGRGHCRVTFRGAAASVRASICNWQNFSCVSHLEAR